MARHILITGANKGIGLATVRAVLEAADDTHVWLGSRDGSRGEAARETLGALADRVDVVELDVTSDRSVAAAAAMLRERAGTLYGVINNAGIGLGETDLRHVLDVNVLGPKRVCEAVLPFVDGRVVNISSASGPSFVARCSPEKKALLTDPGVTWETIREVMDACLALDASGGDFAAAGFGANDAYGLSKACLNAYTMLLARTNPGLRINACTPGFIETDLTRPYADSRGVPPSEMGMKPPAHGAKTPAHLMLGDVRSTGWFYGSDQERSPLDRYRSPGDPPYTGD